MAQVTDYGTLKTYISATGHRGDLGTHIPGFIQSAEDMIAAKVRAVELVDPAGTIIESDRVAGPIYNLPADFLGARAVLGTQSGDAYEVKQVSIAELYRYGVTGNPVVFSVYGKLIEFRAAPAVNAAFTLVYYKRPAAFTQDIDSNLLLLAHPVLYQHASMHWFHIHTMDYDPAGAHLDAFNAYADDVNALAEEVRGTGVVAPQFNYQSRSTM